MRTVGIAGANINSDDKDKQAAAHKLQEKIHEVLNHDDHKWYLNKQDPAEEKLRQERMKAFQERYSSN